MHAQDNSGEIRAVCLDFTGVVATVRLAAAGDRSDHRYVATLHTNVLDRVSELRSTGRKTALLTNNDRAAFAKWLPHVDLAMWFDVVVFSSDLGVGKPDPRIYHHACSLLEVAPQQALLFDDLAGNVDAARAVGMYGEVTETPAAAALALDRLLLQLRPPHARNHHHMPEPLTDD